MSVQINISGNIIEFPSSAQSPNWAPALVEFAQAVEGALAGVAGDYDVPPTTISIVNTGILTEIPQLSFSSAAVRSVVVRYGYLRKTDTAAAEYETGLISLVSTEGTPAWLLERDYTGNTTPTAITPSGLLFSIDNDGKISYTAPVLTGANYEGKLTFSAQALKID